ncbi:MAG: redoxin domain-containing protein [Chloroflexota bacterium]
MDDRPKSRGTFPLILAGLLAGIGLGVLLLFGIPWLQSRQAAGSNSLEDVARLDQPAVDFELGDLSGEPLKLSSLQGKVVLLNFWASWCTPCRAEMPLFQQVQSQYPDELVVVGVNNGESEKAAGDFAAEVGVPFPILLDAQGEVGRAYQVNMLPITYLIDQQGMIRFRHIGQITETQLASYLDALGVGK